VGEETRKQVPLIGLTYLFPGSRLLIRDGGCLEAGSGRPGGGKEEPALRGLPADLKRALDI